MIPGIDVGSSAWNANRRAGDDRRLMSISEVASEFAIQRGYLYRAIGEGDLRAYRPGKRKYRVSRSDVYRWLRKKRVPSSNAAAARKRAREIIEAEHLGTEKPGGTR